MADADYEVLTGSRFYLELRVDGGDDRIDGYFMECLGFKRTQEVIEFCQVTPQKWGKDGNSVGRVVRSKIPGNITSGNLTLKRGMTISTALWDWFKAIEQGHWSRQRRDGDLTVYDQSSTERARFRFLGAWPLHYTISDAKVGNPDFQIEELELVVDEFVRVK